MIEQRTVIQGRVKIRMIESIEKLGAKLQIQVLLDFVILEEGEIKVHDAWPVNLIVTTIAQEI